MTIAVKCTRCKNKSSIFYDLFWIWRGDISPLTLAEFGSPKCRKCNGIGELKCPVRHGAGRVKRGTALPDLPERENHPVQYHAPLI